MHDGCGGRFENGRQVADKVRMMGYDTMPVPAPLVLRCVQCETTFRMQTMLTHCPKCRMLYAVTPCHAHSARHVMPAGIDEDAASPDSGLLPAG